jgi:hypothetical protein
MLSPKLVFLVALTLSASTVLAGEAFTNQQLGLRLSVPDGFAQDPDLVSGKVVCGFRRPPSGDQRSGTLIRVSRLGGVLGREKIDPQQLAAANPRVTTSTEKWKEFEIDVFRVPENINGVSILTFNAQVPLKPEAVQVAVSGGADREEELRGLLRSTLNNLDGQSNWLTNHERVERLADGITKLATTAGVVVVLAVAAGAAIWRSIRRRSTGGRGRRSGRVGQKDDFDD